MKKLTVLALGLLLLVPSLVFADSFSLRVGYFLPRALNTAYAASHPDSLWTIEFDQMSFSKDKFRGTSIGFSYEYFVNKNFSLALTLDTYSKSAPGYYVDYGQFELEEGNFAFPYEFYDADPIQHAFNVSSTPLQLSLRVTPFGRKTRLIPFFGGGAGLYFWGARIIGEMVDFSDPWVYTDEVLGDIDVYPVQSANGREKGAVFGYHAFGGLQIPIGYRATIEAEARYHWAKARFDEWFLGFDEFDLGGLSLTLGFSYWF